MALSKKIRALLARKQTALVAAKALTEKADAETRELSDAEKVESDKFIAQITVLNADIERQTALDLAESQMTGIDITGPASVSNLEPVILKDPKRGFESFGQFVRDVKTASHSSGRRSERLEVLVAAPTTYASEGVGADGGFAIPPEYRDQIMSVVLGEDELLSKTDQITTSKNSLVVPIDESAPWATTGVSGTWLDEGGLKPQSKPVIKQLTIRLNKFGVLCPITDELLDDSPAMASYLPRKAAEKISFAMNLAIVQGTGVGQPLGILNSGALVSVAKETSQVAATVVALNVLKMWTRMYAPYRRNAVWLANQDIEPQLALLMKVGKLDTGANDTGWGVGPLYYSGLGTEGPTLMGRPVIYTQACETLGDQGDLILADMKQYLSLVKGGGVKTDVSMHLWFDYDLTAYRFVLRVGGMPWLTTPIPARDGSATYSSFVTLDAR